MDLAAPPAAPSVTDAVDLVVTDLDGTLWGADERIHDRTLDALRELQRRRVPLLVATGRRRGSAVRTLARSGIRLPTVVLDGALGCDVDRRRVFHRASFRSEQAGRVLEVFRAAGLSPCVYVDRPEHEVVVDGRPSTHPRHVRGLGTQAVRGALEHAVATEHVLMFAIVGGAHETFEAVAAALDPADGAATVTRDVVYGGATITVKPPGVSKWDGVLAWCEDQGLDARRVLAVGDGRNDVELLSGAAVACAVSDGCEEVLALAHHVLDPPAHGGWSAILDLVDAGVTSGERGRAIR